MVELEDQKTGIQRVVRETVAALRTLPLTTQYQPTPIAFPQLVPLSISGDGRPGEEVRFRSSDLLLMLNSTWGQYLSFADHFARLREARGMLVTAIYDLVPLPYPDLVVQGMRRIFDTWFRRAILESDGLVCISRAVADEVIDYIAEHDLPFRDGLRIGWWHLGSDLEPRDEGGSVRPELEAFLAGPEPVFLMVGTIEPRKRHAVVLDALEGLWREGSDARLLLIGKAGWADPHSSSV